MVTVIGQFTADSRVEPKSNAHLPISADDRVDIWYTPTDLSADWLLRRFKFRIGGIAPIIPDDRVGVQYTPTDERRFSVGSWRYRQLPTASR